MTNFVKIDLGVPQGSVLDPVPFITYVNDMMLSIIQCDENQKLYQRRN